MGLALWPSFASVVPRTYAYEANIFFTFSKNFYDIRPPTTARQQNFINKLAEAAAAAGLTCVSGLDLHDVGDQGDRKTNTPLVCTHPYTVVRSVLVLMQIQSAINYIHRLSH